MWALEVFAISVTPSYQAHDEAARCRSNRRPTAGWPQS